MQHVENGECRHHSVITPSRKLRVKAKEGFGNNSFPELGKANASNYIIAKMLSLCAGSRIHPDCIAGICT